MLRWQANKSDCVSTPLCSQYAIPRTTVYIARCCFLFGNTIAGQSLCRFLERYYMNHAYGMHPDAMGDAVADG
jgi:hypothetical protein